MDFIKIQNLLRNGHEAMQTVIGKRKDV